MVAPALVLAPPVAAALAQAATALVAAAAAYKAGQVIANQMADANEKAGDLSAADQSETCKDCKSSDADDPITEERARHILDGEKSSGGHRAGTGTPGKTEFPKDWSDEKILDSVRDAAKTGEVLGPAHRPGDVVKTKTIDGVRVDVVVRPDGKVRTGYPVSGPGVIRNPR